VREAGIDADVQQWFHVSPLAPQPTRPAMVEDGMKRLFREMAVQLGFDPGAIQDKRRQRGLSAD
jgi:hypothetical protein